MGGILTMNKFGLCSGGKDSIVAVHKMMQEAESGRKNPVVVYLDTTIGIPENRKYVESLCDEYGWQLWTLRTPANYDEIVDEYGFPGPGQHTLAYSYLKERQLRKLASVSDDPHFYTGIRRSESDRRMGNAERVDENLGAVWHSDIIDWTLDDVEEYIEENGIPQNPLWNNGHFKDCGCGAFGTREELIELEADYPEMYERITAIEQEIDRDDTYTLWAWGSLSGNAQRSLEAQNDDEQLTLCSRCGKDKD
jgi:3'-phosphoadenosine 5'-phosphosulfate sulfotransferase (PAPS reductase)/FAD synthetase